jgi:hypothetical protein
LERSSQNYSTTFGAPAISRSFWEDNPELFSEAQEFLQSLVPSKIIEEIARKQVHVRRSNISVN